MKNWINRFAMLAVLGSVVCGVLVAGCGGDGADSTTTTTDANGATTKTETETDE